MTKQYRKPQSKGMHNIKSAANRTLKTTSTMAAQGIEKTASWMTTDHIGTSDSSIMMELGQSINFTMAKIRLVNRRADRSYNQLNNEINTDSQTSVYAIIWGWFIDHLLLVFDLLWGFVEPILTLIFITIVKIVLIILANCIFFYGLYLLFTARST
jgi:hypothetical protein